MFLHDGFQACVLSDITNDGSAIDSYRFHCKNSWLTGVAWNSWCRSPKPTFVTVPAIKALWNFARPRHAFRTSCLFFPTNSVANPMPGKYDVENRAISLYRTQITRAGTIRAYGAA